jgi:hypothetical protein
MYTTPSMEDLLVGLVTAISDEILPFLTTPKAQATATMMQSIILEIRQLLPVYDGYLAEEHNGMTQALRDAAAALEDVGGEAADRIRARAATLGELPDLPPPPDRAAVMAAHRELSTALVATVADLDELQRAGKARADAALEIVRAHLAPRLVRDAETMTVGSGFVGRG